MQVSICWPDMIMIGQNQKSFQNKPELRRDSALNLNLLIDIP
jgi:hypothetical protein